MYPRTNYEMTQADLESLFEAMKPVPMIMLQCGPGRSQQDRANDAWKALGDRMGFDHMTVQPTGQGDRFFSAVPNESEETKARKAAEKAEAERQEEIKAIIERIEKDTARLNALNTQIP